MPYKITQNDSNLPKIAASNVKAMVPVKGDTVKDQVVPAAAFTDRVIGFTQASAAQGEPVSVYTQGIVYGIAAASMGVGAEVACATTGGQLSLITAASGVDRIAIGELQTAGAAGTEVAVLLTYRSVQTGGG